jgi:hypothetical protein
VHHTSSSNATAQTEGAGRHNSCRSGINTTICPISLQQNPPFLSLSGVSSRLLSMASRRSGVCTAGSQEPTKAFTLTSTTGNGRCARLHGYWRGQQSLSTANPQLTGLKRGCRLGLCAAHRKLNYARKNQFKRPPIVPCLEGKCDLLARPLR